MIIEIKYKKLISDIGKRVYEKGFVAANDGNISVRIDENEFLITPTNVSKGFLTPEMIIKVDGEGNVIEGDFKPTSEMKMHLLVYHERPDVHAVLHAHPPYATAFAIAGLPLDQAIMPEAVVSLGTIPLAQYGTPSTDEVPKAIKAHVYDHQGVLLENHGALTWGKNLEHAYYLMESLEFTAKINWISRQLKGDRELSKENVAKLIDIKAMMGVKGISPLGVDVPEGTQAKKVTAVNEQTLSERDIDLIVDRVTTSVLNALKK
ncbi:class II aldolase/adducin family protein [Neobacillus sp. NPDC093182]|uniref:class II aldolase/adducin family protein n=1 Tax=Neobacillus sp. NPDC093182 TaxID=3364297 RepID=UPI0037FCEABE